MRCDRSTRSPGRSSERLWRTWSPELGLSVFSSCCGRRCRMISRECHRFRRAWPAMVGLVIVFLPASVVLLHAASPPTLVNYQGVLRNASNAPLTGTYDMVFRFFSASSGGDEILVDSHTAGGGSAVSVSGGLFNVQLGGGTVTDGAGPGSYASLADLFRDYTDVWLEVHVGSETLSPRTRVVSAAYALNSQNLGGQGANYYLDTSSAPQ